MPGSGGFRILFGKAYAADNRCADAEGQSDAGAYQKERGHDVYCRESVGAYAVAHEHAVAYIKS